MAYENLCMYCLEDNGGADVCPHCGRDAREAVPQIQLLPGTLVYRERFLVGRALGQDASGIVYNALDTKRGVKIRIREYLPRDCARRLNDGGVVPEAGSEDAFEAGLNKLRASVEGVEDPAKRHFFFEENGTGYIAQRKNALGTDDSGASADESDHRGTKMALVVGVAAVLVLAVAAGVIWFVTQIANKTDTTTTPMTTGEDIWSPPESPTPTPYAAATFGAITDPTHSWMEFTNPDLSGSASDFAKPTPVPTPENGFGGNGTTISSASSATSIRKLQKLLINLGWLGEYGESGGYDSATRQAVREFQQYVNDNFDVSPKLSVDGIAGPKTLQWLLQTEISIRPTPTPAPITPSPTQKNQVVDQKAGTAAIKYVQTQLYRLGALTQKQITGKYDKNTSSAVRSFQRRVNDLMGYDCLNEDGICDDSTLAYLDYYVQWWEANHPTPAPAGTVSPEKGETITEKSDPASIRYVQQMLISLGYLSGKADGAYGSKTYAAVSRFQQFVIARHGNVVPADGKCDATTREYLEYYSSQQETTAAPSAEAPAITVTGAEEYTGGVYLVGPNGVKISWTAAGADTYSVYLSDKSGNIISREEGTRYTALTLSAASLSATEDYVFRVLAIPQGGDAAQGASSYVKLIATPDAQPTPAATKVGVPTITVSGASGYSEGVYHLESGSATVTWNADGAQAYSMYLTDGDDEMVVEVKNTVRTTYQIDAGSLREGEKYTFSVVAIPDSGVEADGEYASVRMVADQVATAKPTVTPAADVRTPVIEIQGALGYEQEAYWVGKDPIIIGWSAEGSVRAYSVYLTNAAGDTLISQQETTEQYLQVQPASMNGDDVYTVTVYAIPDGGTEENGVSASETIRLYDGRTPEPTPQPVGEVEDVTITVSGHRSYENGIYYAKTDALAIAWSAEGEVEGYDLSLSADGVMMSNRQGVTGKTYTLDPEDLEDGVTYEFTVTAVPARGSAEDGKTASVLLAKYVTPALEKPVIMVEGAEYEEGGVYYAGKGALTLTWECENAAAYDLSLTTEDGEKIKAVKASAETGMDLKTDFMKRGETYFFTVSAVNEDGKRDSEATASVQLAKAEPQAVTQPEITVEGYAEFADGIYYADEEDLTVSWTAENAGSYDVTVTGGAKDNEAKGVAQTSLTLKRSQMEQGLVYTMTVLAIPEEGKADDGRSASVRFALVEPEPTPEPTAAPTPEPKQMSKPEIGIKGQLGYTDDTYYVGMGELNISWASENAAYYNVTMTDDNGDVVKTIEHTDHTSAKLNGATLLPGQTYTLVVTPVDEYGNEGASETIRMTQYEVDSTPEPSNLGEVELTVSGEEAFSDGVYYVGSDSLTIRWYAENAEKYYVSITSDDGSDPVDKVTTSTETTFAPKQLKKGTVYTVEVSALDPQGDPGEPAVIYMALAENPVSKPGRPFVDVSGYETMTGDIYRVGEDPVEIMWEAENAAGYLVSIVDDLGNAIYPENTTRQTSVTVNPSKLNEGSVYTLSVTALDEAGERGETAQARFSLMEKEPVEMGMPEIEVTGYAETNGDLYYLGDTGAQITWQAENAAGYAVSIVDDLGDELFPESVTTKQGVSIAPNQVAEGRVYTLTVTALDEAGNRGETAQVRFGIGTGLTVMEITPESDPADIQSLQMRLYELGWLENDGTVVLGTLDEATVAAVYAYQEYIITNGYNPELSLIDPLNPVVDEITMTMLADTLNPIQRPPMVE